MKIGDLVRWIGNEANRDPNGKIGIVIGLKGVFWQILWSDGKCNGNPSWQMEVINEDWRPYSSLAK